MSTKLMVEAARNENPAAFEKGFNAVIGAKLAEALAVLKKGIIAKQFGIVAETGDDCEGDKKMPAFAKDGNEDDEGDDDDNKEPKGDKE